MCRDDADGLLDFIKNRRSIFPVNYIEKPIEKSLIMEFLEWAEQAPTHKLTEPWRFVVFRGDGLKKLAAELQDQYVKATSKDTFLSKKHQSIEDKVRRSGAVIAVCMHESGKVPQWEELAAVAAAVQNLSLAASAKGVGSYWSSPATLSALGAFLNLEENESCVGLLYMGYHDEEPQKGNRSGLMNKVSWVEEY